jgi:hypothetical protein
MLDMEWQADRSTIFAIIFLVASGWERIVIRHDFVFGGKGIGLGIAIAVRAFLNYQSPDAWKFARAENSI